MTKNPEPPEAKGEVEGMNSTGAACPICGKPHQEWTENSGKGLEKNGLLFCSQTCVLRAQQPVI